MTHIIYPGLFVQFIPLGTCKSQLNSFICRSVSRFFAFSRICLHVINRKIKRTGNLSYKYRGQRDMVSKAVIFSAIVSLGFKITRTHTPYNNEKREGL